MTDSHNIRPILCVSLFPQLSGLLSRKLTPKWYCFSPQDHVQTQRQTHREVRVTREAPVWPQGCLWPQQIFSRNCIPTSEAESGSPISGHRPHINLEGTRVQGTNSWRKRKVIPGYQFIYFSRLFFSFMWHINKLTLWEVCLYWD